MITIKRFLADNYFFEKKKEKKKQREFAVVFFPQSDKFFSHSNIKLVLD